MKHAGIPIAGIPDSVSDISVGPRVHSVEKVGNLNTGGVTPLA